MNVLCICLWSLWIISLWCTWNPYKQVIEIYVCIQYMFLYIFTASATEIPIDKEKVWWALNTTFITEPEMCLTWRNIPAGLTFVQYNYPRNSSYPDHVSLSKTLSKTIYSLSTYMQLWQWRSYQDHGWIYHENTIKIFLFTMPTANIPHFSYRWPTIWSII